ncbi:hypothetical protein TNCT_180361 [Trichonephila clavata]|uniref:Uncharacterized protein n=1 Tax=Trichonephila clavata TaxID=2740835 RepID=A0A8X6FNS0_TRICU|nr:hypothetical protein TNCT_180361 [Trichonephila clavata]
MRFSQSSAQVVPHLKGSCIVPFAMDQKCCYSFYCQENNFKIGQKLWEKMDDFTDYEGHVSGNEENLEDDDVNNDHVGLIDNATWRKELKLFQ